MKISSNLRYILATLLALFIVGAISVVIIVLYFTNRAVPLNLDSAGERKAKLADVNAKQNELITTYGWIDKTSGMVRIPVERAMMLTVEELSKKQDSGSKQQEENLSKD